jgi:hypothetical protein
MSTLVSHITGNFRSKLLKPRLAETCVYTLMLKSIPPA